MGKLNAGILSNLRGKVGNVVGRDIQGRTVLSVYQPNVRNPRTAAQMAIRSDFSLVSKFMSTMSQYVRYGFHYLDGYKTGNYFSSAVGYNLKHNAVTGSGDNREVDFNKVLLSEGKIALPYSPSATADGTIISLTWSDNSGMGDAKSDDAVMIACYNTSKEVAVSDVNVAERNERNATFTLPTAWTGDNVCVWMSMRRGEYECSNSLYLGTISL